MYLSRARFCYAGCLMLRMQGRFCHVCSCSLKCGCQFALQEHNRCRPDFSESRLGAGDVGAPPRAHSAVQQHVAVDILLAIIFFSLGAFVTQSCSLPSAQPPDRLTGLSPICLSARPHDRPTSKPPDHPSGCLSV